MPKICSVEGCDRPNKARGLCKMHHKRWLQENPHAPRRPGNHVQNGIVGPPEKDPTYLAWRIMCRKCYAKRNTQYPKYGGRGIKMTDRWRGPGGFLHFREDMGVRPAGKYLDRIDYDRNFTPENCCWVTLFELKRRRPGRTEHKGIGLMKGRWLAKIFHHGRTEHIGSFDTREEAIAARDAREKELLHEIQTGRPAGSR